MGRRLRGFSRKLNFMIQNEYRAASGGEAVAGTIG
jgi:hypothetical protein